MATRFHEAETMDAVEIAINKCFNELLLAVNRRRVAILTEYRERKEEMRAEEGGRVKTKDQLLETKVQVQEGMTENLLHTLQRRITEDIEVKLRNIELTNKPEELVFECDVGEVEDIISKLGQVKLIPSIPNYTSLTQPRISVCEKGTEPGQLNSPFSIAYCQTRRLIYVADHFGVKPYNGIICIFSENGEYIKSFGQEHLRCPVGVAIHGDNIYVSDSRHHALFHFILPEYQLVTRVGSKQGSGINEFSNPQRISTDSNGDIYVADHRRIVVMDRNLTFKLFIRDPTMNGPCDVKLLNDEVYVLSSVNNPCLFVFSKSGSKLRSFITSGKGSEYQVEQGYCFCFDRYKNILIGDYEARRIKVFSPTGSLLHELGDIQDKDKMIKPQGILVTENNKIVCSSWGLTFGLHIFF